MNIEAGETRIHADIPGLFALAKDIIFGFPPVCLRNTTVYFSYSPPVWN